MDAGELPAAGSCLAAHRPHPAAVHCDCLGRDRKRRRHPCGARVDPQQLPPSGGRRPDRASPCRQLHHRRLGRLNAWHHEFASGPGVDPHDQPTGGDPDRARGARDGIHLGGLGGLGDAWRGGRPSGGRHGWAGRRRRGGRWASRRRRRRLMVQPRLQPASGSKQAGQGDHHNQGGRHQALGLCQGGLPPSASSPRQRPLARPRRRLHFPPQTGAHLVCLRVLAVRGPIMRPRGRRGAGTSRPGAASAGPGRCLDGPAG